VLTPKQEKFCLTYLETGNASEAYRQSYSPKNWKPETVHRAAKRNLESSKIRTRIAE
jgi:phage terminase small subunit